MEMVSRILWQVSWSGWKAENGGCPMTDRDMDGVDDSMDKCPDVKGSMAAGGCPDSDNDGVADPDDKCPKLAGPAH